MISKLEKSLQEAWKKIEENTLIDTNSLGKPIADSPEKLDAFWKWFGKSKAIDSEGRPLVVYHGTFKDFDQFDLSKANPSQYENGIFFTERKDVALLFGDKIKSCYIKAEVGIKEKRQSIKNGKEIKRDHLRPLEDERKIWIVYSNDQIRSTNSFNRPPFITEEDTNSNLIETNSLGKPISTTPEGTKNFWKWFNSSKVVDSEGRPIVVYHGTRSTFNAIDLKKGAQGIFWVSSDKEKIERGESGAISSKVIMELYIKLKNPAHWDEYEKFGIAELISRGFDGVILNEDDGSFDAIVFHANQVKSVNNKGTFSNSSNLVNEANSSFKVPLDSLYSPKWKVEESYKEILKGELSKTDGPIKVSKIGRNKFFIIDGNHRTIEAILNSESSLMATLDEFYPDLTKTGGAFNSELEKTVQVTKYLKSIS
jgi:hypothetical protein